MDQKRDDRTPPQTRVKVVCRHNNDNLWQDSGELSSSEEEPEETCDTDAHLTQQEWEDLLGESDDDNFEGFV